MVYMKILVIGDAMLDWDNYANVDRLSPEAPVLVADVVSEKFRLGGALNVAHNLKVLGADVTVTGVVGADFWKDKLCSEIAKEGINDNLFSVINRRTTVKQRFLDCNNTHLFRGDREDRGPLDDIAKNKLCEYIRETKDDWDGVVLADYNKGVVKEYLVDVLSEISSPVFADLKPQQMKLFHGLEVITPNLKEAKEAAAFDAKDGLKLGIEDVGRSLLQNSKVVIITLGANGLCYFADDTQYKIDRIELPSMDGCSVVDTCGCGDVVTAVYSYSILAGHSIPQAAKIANTTAWSTTKEVGVSCISNNEYNDIVAEVVAVDEYDKIESVVFNV